MDGTTLLTDLYQLTMAYGYWKTGRAEHEAVFHLHFRKPPFGGGYTIAAGLEPVVDWLRAFRFAADDLGYLAGIPGNDGKPIFDAGFLDYLAALRLSVDIDAIPEGTVVFPHQPLIRVRGSILGSSGSRVGTDPASGMSGAFATGVIIGHAQQRRSLHHSPTRSLLVHWPHGMSA